MTKPRPKLKARTPEELAAFKATMQWNSPLPAKPEALEASPLFCGVPYFENTDVLTPGHSDSCGCPECFAAYCQMEAVR